MTIYVPWWAFVAAIVFVLAVLAAGFVAGRAERRERREVAEIERQLAAEQTSQFAAVPATLALPAAPGWYGDTDPVPDADRTVEVDDDWPRAGLADRIDDAMDIYDDEPEAEEPEPQRDAVAVVVAYEDVQVGDHTVRAGSAYAAATCRRGALIEQAVARLAPLVASVAAWLGDLHSSWGADRAPTWAPGEVAAMTVALRHKHESDGTSDQAEGYRPQHAAETESARRPAAPDWSPLSLAVRRLIAPNAVEWRAHRLRARAALRRTVSAQATRRAA